MTRLKPKTLMIRAAPAMLAGMLLVLTACSESPRGWHGTPLPDDFPTLQFELHTGSAEPLTERDFEEQLTLLFFGYLSCPDVCPATMAKLRDALANLPEADAARVRVLFVSVDPARDTPERLAAYAAHFGPAFTAASNSPDQLRRLTSRYGSSFQLEESTGQHYLVAHGSQILAFDGSGQARLMLPHDADVDALQRDIRRLLQQYG
jgi:protein SCO1